MSHFQRRFAGRAGTWAARGMMAAWVGLACANGAALGQTEPATKKDEEKKAPAPAVKIRQKPANTSKMRPNQRVTVPSKPGTKAAETRRGPKRGQQEKPFEMDPNAKWACDEQTATHEPVWANERNVTFKFVIRNEGTADLKIKGKGG